MSETCDVNVLIYASNSASPHHRKAATFLANWAPGPGPRYLFWPVLLGYLRIATHPAVLSPPLSRRAAMANVEALLALPNVRVVRELDTFWPVLRELVDSVHATGNQIPDVHLVALMRQHGVATIWTHDRDFRRFDGITVRDPLA